MERNPLWIGEVGIVRAIFGHAAHASPDRLRRIAPQAILGRVVQVRLEERIRKRRLDVLAAFGDGSGRADQYLVVEAKVGAVIDPGTLAEYLARVRAAYGSVEGLLVAAYEPVGELPSGWAWRDLEDVADLLSGFGHGLPFAQRGRVAQRMRDLGVGVGKEVSWYRLRPVHRRREAKRSKTYAAAPRADAQRPRLANLIVAA